MEAEGQWSPGIWVSLALAHKTCGLLYVMPTQQLLFSRRPRTDCTAQSLLTRRRAIYLVVSRKLYDHRGKIFKHLEIMFR